MTPREAYTKAYQLARVVGNLEVSAAAEENAIFFILADLVDYYPIASNALSEYLYRDGELYYFWLDDIRAKKFMRTYWTRTHPFQKVSPLVTLNRWMKWCDNVR